MNPIANYVRAGHIFLFAGTLPIILNCSNRELSEFVAMQSIIQHESTKGLMLDCIKEANAFVQHQIYDWDTPWECGLVLFQDCLETVESQRFKSVP